MDKELSYRQLDDAVNRFAAAMQNLGVKKADGEAMFMPNCPHLVIAYYGAMRAGGMAVPGNFMYTAAEMAHQLNDAGAEIVVATTDMLGNLSTELGEADISLLLADAQFAIRSRLQHTGLLDRIGEGHLYLSISEAVADVSKRLSPDLQSGDESGAVTEEGDETMT
jgi:acyl-CoA synthetase (AMP-forming)/AMP-acid ligase II